MWIDSTGDWSQIQQAEVDVSLVKPDYIIEGKVDLIRGEGDTVELWILNLSENLIW